MKKLSRILLAVTLFVFFGAASAVPIGGALEFSGGYTTDTGNKNTATVFTFLNPISVIEATEDFLPLNGQAVTYNALDINSLPATTLWSATVDSVFYAYDLNKLTTDMVIGNFRLIEGIGTFTIGNNTGTGTWSFSTQGSGAGGIFSFSASQIPGPTPFILTGFGLILISVTRKLRATESR